VDKEELVKFQNSFASGYRDFLKRILQHCEIRHFPAVWLISPEKLIGSSCKFIIVGQGKFASHQHSESGSRRYSPLHLAEICNV